MTVLAEIAAVLKTTEKNVPARLINMKLAPVCGRCGGCGQYSFNMMDGTRCYGCNGYGHTVPKERDLPAMLIAATEAAADGRLAAYERYLEAKRTTKNATDRVMAAWKATGVSAEYDWRKVNGEKAVQRDREIAAINHKMYVAYEQASRFRLNPKAPTYRDDVIAFAAVVAEALETIKAADAELKEYLANNPIAL